MFYRAKSLLKLQSLEKRRPLLCRLVRVFKFARLYQILTLRLRICKSFMISHQRQIFPPLVRLSHPARPSFTLGKLSSLLITLAALIENELCKLATTIAERLRNPRQITSLPSVSLSKWCSTSVQRPTIYRDTGKIRTIQRRSFQMSSRLPISSMLFNLICSTKSITHRQKEREMASKQLQIRLGLQLSSLRQKCQIQELSVVRSTCKHLRDKAKM